MGIKKSKNIFSLVFLGLLIFMGLLRFGYQCYDATFSSTSWIAVDAQYKLLHEFVSTHKITDNPRYGPVYFLLHLPFIFLGSDYAQFILVGIFYLLAIVLTFVLIIRFLQNIYRQENVYKDTAGREYNVKFLFFALVLFLNFSPCGFAVKARFTESVEVLFLFLFFQYLYRNRTYLASLMLALAALIKVLPIAFLYYLLIKQRKVFLFTCLNMAVLFLFGYIIFGEALGSKFLFMMTAWGSRLILSPENLQFIDLLYNILNKPPFEIIYKIHLATNIVVFALLTALFIYSQKKYPGNKKVMLLELGLFLTAILTFAGGIGFNTLILFLPSLFLLFYEIFYDLKKYGLKFKIIFIVGYTLICGGIIPISVWDRILSFIFINHFYPNEIGHHFFFLKIPTYGLLIVFTLYLSVFKKFLFPNKGGSTFSE